jgi:hypothetical protein
MVRKLKLFMMTLGFGRSLPTEKLSADRPHPKMWPKNASQFFSSMIRMKTELSMLLIPLIPLTTDADLKTTDADPKITDADPKITDADPKITDADPKITDIKTTDAKITDIKTTDVDLKR